MCTSPGVFYFLLCCAVLKHACSDPKKEELSRDEFFDLLHTRPCAFKTAMYNSMLSSMGHKGDLDFSAFLVLVCVFCLLSKNEMLQCESVSVRRVRVPC